VHVADAAHDRVRRLVGRGKQPRALLVVASVVPHPGFAQHLPPEAAFVILALVVPGVFDERPVGDAEGVCRGADAEHRPAALEVVDDVLHFGGGKVLKA